MTKKMKVFRVVFVTIIAALGISGLIHELLKNL